ncbi:MAG: hypothetical protein FWF03_06555 [Defluviitaleaceae bacterium]|nr:hypothetical protein [Defluviitaleaceae bacterium]
MKRLIAIDQGGTKTDALIADVLGNILSFEHDRDRPAEWDMTRDGRMRRIKFAADKAAKSSGVGLDDVDSVYACCTCADWPFEYELDTQRIRETLGISEVRLYNDCIGAMRGGTKTRGKDCAILCLGTGGNCAVQNKDGGLYVYAYYFKSEHQGSGAIGRFVFQAVCDSEAGLIPKTAFTDLLLSETGYASVDELHMALTTGRSEFEAPWRPRYHDYTHLLYKAISSGDEVAVNYFEKFSADMANYVISGAKRLGITDRPLTLVLSGGVLKNFGMSEIIARRVLSALPGTRCVDAAYEPVVGSLLLGFDDVYPDGLPDDVLKNIDEGCEKFGLFRELA